ncbi:hypothetical protein CATYP_07790 [Corynebacterium atypicum]|uniref:HTH arsR-type domain-containing protein n=1 Tax=Corynebacterium atypicum TaxID=191610 RepID=A0ABN4DDQ2_9CORY|nr:metalloregulator ArsR/SmtB family transcription factor [Corynebacterium atypicum]AIG64503.1 hypothetical protein CATYP_07790 [Corynebacterium atypicum]
MTTKILASPQANTTEDLVSAAAIIGALDSMLRLRIIRILQTGDHYVHELVAELDKSQPLISQHLKVLKCSGIVECERRGREVLYRLSRGDVCLLIDLAASVAERIRKDSPQE